MADKKGKKLTKRMYVLIQRIGEHWYGASNQLKSSRVMAERMARYAEKVEQWQTIAVPIEVPDAKR